MTAYTNLIQVTGPDFCVAIVVDDRVREAAPILRSTLLGKRRHEAHALIQKRGWSAVVVREPADYLQLGQTHQRGS